MLTIKAALHSARVDKDGEWKVTFIIPETEGSKVAALTTLIEQILTLSIEPDKEESEK